MKKLISTISILLVITSGFSQTSVIGAYFSNTTWNISGSPYNVVGDVQIPSGITLTIAPGVQVNFTGNYEILIKGKIIGNGTKLLPITFTGNTPGRAMLMFKSTNLTTSQLSYIKMNGPKGAIQLAEEGEFNEDATKNSETLTVTNSVFTYTNVRTQGYQTNASLVLDSVTISRSLIKGLITRSETIEIKNSTLSNDTLISDSYNAGIILRNSYVIGSEFKLGCCGANFNIISSTIIASSMGEREYDLRVAGPLKIIESKLDNCPINLPSTTVEITNSIIDYSSSTGLIVGNGFINCSKITGDGSGTAVNITGYAGYNIGGTLSVINSSINQNLIGIQITDAANTLTIDSSNFNNNSSYNIENLSLKNVVASNNWWGTTDSTTISNKIFDYYDDINLGTVFNFNKLYAIYTAQSCLNSLVFPTAISENKNDREASVFGLKIYPNPSSVCINLDFNMSVTRNEDVSIEISNTMGQIVFVEHLNKSATTQIINVSGYKKGIYFCKIQSGKDIEVKKLLVQ